MAYSTDYRLCVVNNIKQGMTWDKAIEIFHISRQTLSNWLKLWEQRRDLSDPPRKVYQPRKIAVNELVDLVEKEPDGTLAEYAAHFGCSAQAIANRLKQQKITRKKKHFVTKKETKQSDKHT